MLSPNYLVFVSMVVILLLIGITTVSYSIVNRQNAFKRYTPHKHTFQSIGFFEYLVSYLLVQDTWAVEK